MSDLTIQNLPSHSMPKVAATTRPAPATSNSVGGGSLPTEAVNPSRNIGANSSSSISQNDSVIQANTKAGEDIGPVVSAKVTVNNSSSIMTYRDSESGRLVVRVVDENSNALISEFPSKTMLGNYPKTVSSSSTPSVDTKT